MKEIGTISFTIRSSPCDITITPRPDSLSTINAYGGTLIQNLMFMASYLIALCNYAILLSNS